MGIDDIKKCDALPPFCNIVATFKSFSLVFLAKQENGNGEAIVLAERFQNFRVLFKFSIVFYVLVFKETVVYTLGILFF